MRVNTDVEEVTAQQIVSIDVGHDLFASSTQQASSTQGGT